MAAAAGVCLLVCGKAMAGPCIDLIDSAAPVLSDGFASNLSNTRNNPSQITSGNVARLQLALTYIAGGSKEKRGAPAMTEQAVFLSAGRDIVAINRHSGCTYWSYTVPYRYTLLVGGNAVRSAAVYYLNEGGSRPALVLAGDYYGNFYALDAKTGDLRWSRFVGSDPAHHFITGAPQFYDGKLIVPVSSKEVLTAAVELLHNCCRSHGQVHAIDPYTGADLWVYETTADAVYQSSTDRYGPNGGSVWGTPAIDPDRRLVYVGTGQNLTPPTTDNSDSIVALDLDSGAPRWVFQSTSGDAFNIACGLKFPLNLPCIPPKGPDLDFGAPPILARLTDGSEAVIAGAKNGVVYALDPDSGALNWSRRLGVGGTLGGVHWGMAADAGKVYAAVNDATVNKATALALGVKSGIVPVVGGKPGIYALDLASGDEVWEIHPQHSVNGVAYDSLYSAALSVSNDVLFAGSIDGVVKAFSTADGSELWSYDTVRNYVDVDGVQGNGGEIDSVGAIPADTDLMVNSGYDTFGSPNEYQAGGGNALLIFRLPQS
jgi:polyvinyl alcohol dehydrogenase (cytochrome)